MNLARFDLVTLGLFVAVARLGSISAGARQSHLAVAAASKRISDLEAAVGAPLLYRHAAGVELTEAGQACFRHAVGILQDVERMAGALSDFAAGTRGLVRVWANTSSITQFLADDLAAFMLANPAIRIALEEQDSGDIVAALRENRADLGIFAAGTPCEGLQSFDYREDDLALVTPRGHPLAGRKQVRFAEAVDFDFVSLPPGTSLAAQLLEESQRLGKPLRLRIQVRSFEAVCRMVASGLGVGVLPRIAAQAHVASLPGAGLALVPLDDDWAHRRLLVGVRDPDALTSSARLLMTHLLGNPAAL
ncbi:MULTISPECIES: LysR family transcriptional regulator [Ralstonia solanacearum species complex]|uniref:LysR family transcriptional regulator n=1 Tax=Ralstonia syzygii TaxID=28097 RepID=A0ABX7ZFJ6_9RALS|nr:MULTISPECIES: LysR family transcriptional regulator [Ralstonia solanacearum species complex]BEU72488.1 LysR substrate-binding domain-containing protein [Ralstonia pseudosolanacearum]AMP37963.1 GntR family transcriptional regulator [Ralstonia solanacearum]AXV77350.1 GntR family transcriptional regulator [Ralstonia solanacearum]AXV86789.1 GntR family transcriptional regulator [Ralstonia solanacearum]AXV91368.1 GntR family transcriptional regulator [Ralstonia solanacearum]